MEQKFESVELNKIPASKITPSDHQLFEQLNKKYMLLQKQYAKSFEKLSDDILSKGIRKEYSKGGVTLHRGLYSPSSLDLFVGGAGRGKRLKKLPSSNHFDYEYVFDDQDNIICCKKWSDELNNSFCVVSVEFLIYKQDKVLALEYETNRDCELVAISECQYEATLLTRYERALCNPLQENKNCVEVNVEEFEYTHSLFTSVCWWRYAPAIKLLDKSIVTFHRDEEGFLSTYAIREIGRNTQDNSLIQNEKTYSIRGKQLYAYHDTHRLRK